MAITASDLILYGSTGRPTSDTTVTGGGIDLTARPITTPMSSAEIVELISSSSGDTRTVTMVYRDTDGASLTWSPTLAGTSAVPISTGTPQHIMSLTLSSASTTATVTLRMSSGAAIHSVNPTETDAFRMFQFALSSAAGVVRYEKLFLKNVSTDADLSNANIALTSDASTQYTLALSGGKDTSSEWATRITVPTGLTFVDTSSGVDVPSSTLGSSEAIGVVIEQTLAANATEGWPTILIEASGGTVVST